MGWSARPQSRSVPTARMPTLPPRVGTASRSSAAIRPREVWLQSQTATAASIASNPSIPTAPMCASWAALTMSSSVPMARTSMRQPPPTALSSASMGPRNRTTLTPRGERWLRQSGRNRRLRRGSWTRRRNLPRDQLGRQERVRRLRRRRRRHRDPRSRSDQRRADREGRHRRLHQPERRIWLRGRSNPAAQRRGNPDQPRSA